jgi:hypothetical protein
MDQLFALFPDHYPQLIYENATEWVIGLDWSEDEKWYVDPELTRRAAAMLHCGLKQVAEFVEVEYFGRVPIVFSMFHSRALFAPALASIRSGVSHCDAIVHIDAHDDLMGIMLKYENLQWLASTTGEALDLDSIESLESAIRVGTVHKGNFLTCYLLMKPPGTVFHVYEPFTAGGFCLSAMETTFACAGNSLSGINLGVPCKDARDGWRVEELPTLPLKMRGESVWLDVDLDGFCNRFDGDSNRAQIGGTAEERDLMLGRIKRFLNSLGASSWRRRVKAVSIAASPMFFPSEYWDEVVPAIKSGIRNALLLP